MTPEIVSIPEKILVGHRMKMSFTDYKVAELWGGFMPRRKEIKYTVSNDLFSLAVYSASHFSDFNPANEFDRWAAVEVSNTDTIPEQMEVTMVPAGLYAVFLYRGTATDVSAFFRNIYQKWLPESVYILDDRPHFEVLGEKYKNNDPSSEEEIWIPVKAK